MTANQVQIRRDSATNLNAAVPANAELAYDTTDKALRVGDGSTTGGFKVAMAKHVQNQTFQAAAASGTDTITITVSPAPAAYATYQRFVFKAAANNTGTATINVNSLGAKTLKKRTSSGLSDLEANDIIQDGIYAVTYDGTYMQLEDVPSGGSGTSLELISTATASTSATLDVDLPTGYSWFRLVLTRILPATSDVALRMRFSDDGGGTFYTTDIYRSLLSVSVGGETGTITIVSSNDIVSAGQYAAIIAGDEDNNGVSSTGGVNMIIDICGHRSTSGRINCTLSGTYQNTAGGPDTFWGSASSSSGISVDCLRFYFDAGNITSGEILLYGYPE